MRICILCEESKVSQVKEKLKNGIKVKEVLKLYPQMNYGYLYSIKNGRRWSDI